MKKKQSLKSLNRNIMFAFIKEWVVLLAEEFQPIYQAFRPDYRVQFVESVDHRHNVSSFIRITICNCFDIFDNLSLEMRHFMMNSISNSNLVHKNAVRGTISLLHRFVHSSQYFLVFKNVFLILQIWHQSDALQLLPLK